ncbi:CSDC2 isoform 1, partial [Pan troglodytes]
KSPVWPTFPFHREGSRVWERGGVPPRDLPSPLPTKRTRTYSATARASAGPVFKGVCKQFSRSQGHGFITPENGSEDIFVHVSEPRPNSSEVTTHRCGPRSRLMSCLWEENLPASLHRVLRRHHAVANSPGVGKDLKVVPTLHTEDGQRRDI